MGKGRDASSSSDAAVCALQAVYCRVDGLLLALLNDTVQMPRADAVRHLCKVVRCVKKLLSSRRSSFHSPRTLWLSESAATQLLDSFAVFLSAEGEQDEGERESSTPAAVTRLLIPHAGPRKKRRTSPAAAPVDEEPLEEPACDSPWVVSPASFPLEVAAALSVELFQFETFVDLSAAECAAREGLLRRVSHQARRVLGSQVVALPFGSLSAGLATFQSDVDIGLHGAGMHAGRDLRPLATALQRCGWAREVEFRSRARVPIVAFVDRISGVSADISVAAGAAAGDATTAAVRAMSAEWPRLFRPLLLFLKTALAEADLNKPFTGGLGSFKLCALLALYLEEEERRCGGDAQRLTPGHCLLGFLSYVAKRFDFDCSLDFAGVRADFTSVFAWQSLVAFASEAHSTLEARQGAAGGRLRRLVHGARLGRERQLSARKALAAEPAAAVPDQAAAVLPLLRPAPPPPVAVTSLHVFDFDGTLVDTPGPAQGREMLRRAGAPLWTHKSWWGHPESLAPPLPLAPGPAMPAYVAAAARPGALLALLSGRRARLAPSVRAALAACGAPHAPHVECFAADSGSEDTLSFKLRSLDALVRSHCRDGGAAQEVHVWEDRTEHAARFSAFAQQQRAHTSPRLAWHVHHVGPESAAGCGTSLGTSPAPQPPPPLTAVCDVPGLDCEGGYVCYRLPLPREAAAVPPAWRACKEARDGAAEAHVTLLSRTETAAYADAHSISDDPVALHARISAALRAHGGGDWDVMQRGGVGVAADTQAGTCAVFLIMDWPAGAAFRKSLVLSRRDFHVTLGFLGADVHGYRKGARTALRGVEEASHAQVRRAIARRADVLLAGGNSAQESDSESESGSDSDNSSGSSDGEGLDSLRTGSSDGSESDS